MIKIRLERIRDLPEVTHLFRDRARSPGLLCSILYTTSQSVEKLKSETECWWAVVGIE